MSRKTAGTRTRATVATTSIVGLVGHDEDALAAADRGLPAGSWLGIAAKLELELDHAVVGGQHDQLALRESGARASPRVPGSSDSL
jgi:hypothetical protein